MNTTAKRRLEPLREQALEGSRTILLRCLSLEPKDSLALFYDEGTAEAAEMVSQAANEIGIIVRKRFVPLQQQGRFRPGDALPFEDQQALADSTGILTCMSGSAAGMAYRRELVDTGVTDRKYFGHVPGAMQIQGPSDLRSEISFGGRLQCRF